MTPERRALLLRLARADGQPWTEDQAESGWDDHMGEIMYGKDVDAVSTLTEFLLARIVEREAVARAAAPGPWNGAEEGER